MKVKLTKRSKERLLKLADFLRDIPSQLFDLDDFVAVPPTADDPYSVKSVENLSLDKMKKMKLDCGAAACAIGWCPNVFPRSFEWQKADGFVSVVHKFSDEEGFEGAEEFFDIPRIAVLYLFDPSLYREGHRGKISVSNRIRKFVDTGRLPKQSNNYELEDYD